MCDTSCYCGARQVLASWILTASTASAGPIANCQHTGRRHVPTKNHRPPHPRNRRRNRKTSSRIQARDFQHRRSHALPSPAPALAPTRPPTGARRPLYRPPQEGLTSRPAETSRVGLHRHRSAPGHELHPTQRHRPLTRRERQPLRAAAPVRCHSSVPHPPANFLSRCGTHSQTRSPTRRERLGVCTIERAAPVFAASARTSATTCPARGRP